MPEIKFDTGLVTYDINGACQVEFNPTDSHFVEKLFSTFESLDEAQKTFEADKAKSSNPKDVFELARQLDKSMREQIDGIFGQPVSEALFGGMNLYAVANGLPVWSNLVLALMDEVDTGFAREQKLTNPRLAKYTAKYKKRT